MLRQAERSDPAMTLAELLRCLGVVLVIESLAPLLFTRRWRATLLHGLSWRDGQLRFVSALAACLGLGLIWLGLP